VSGVRADVGKIVCRCLVLLRMLCRVRGDFVAASDLRLWLCNLMTTEHSSDHVVMAQVAASLQKESHMAGYVAEIRREQEMAGVVLRECSISKQLEIVGTSVPKLEQLLQSLSGRIIESTKEQFVLVTQAMETHAKTAADSLADVQMKILEAGRASDTQHSGSHETSHQLLRDIQALLQGRVMSEPASSMQPINREFLADQLRPEFGDNLATVDDGGQFEASVSGWLNSSFASDFPSCMSYDAYMPDAADVCGDFGEAAAYFVDDDVTAPERHWGCYQSLPASSITRPASLLDPNPCGLLRTSPCQPSSVSHVASSGAPANCQRQASSIQHTAVSNIPPIPQHLECVSALPTMEEDKENQPHLVQFNRIIEKYCAGGSERRLPTLTLTHGDMRVSTLDIMKGSGAYGDKDRRLSGFATPHKHVLNTCTTLLSRSTDNSDNSDNVAHEKRQKLSSGAAVRTTKDGVVGQVEGARTKVRETDKRATGSRSTHKQLQVSVGPCTQEEALDAPLTTVPVWCFDVETTKGARVIEWAAQSCVSSAAGDKVSPLLQNLVKIPELALGDPDGAISWEMLKNAPTLPEQVAELGRVFHAGSIVASYGAGGDKHSFNNSVRQEGLAAYEGITWVCVLQLARKLLPGLASYKLGDVADHLGIARDKTKEHRAGEDARVLCELWRVLLDRLSLRSDGQRVLTARALLKFAGSDSTDAKREHDYLLDEASRSNLRKVLVRALAKKTFASTLTDAQFLQQVHEQGDNQACLVTGRTTGKAYRMLAVSGIVCLSTITH
jgi:DNA polymerase-3 subunit epsilon